MDELDRIAEAEIQLEEEKERRERQMYIDGVKKEARKWYASRSMNFAKSNLSRIYGEGKITEEEFNSLSYFLTSVAEQCKPEASEIVEFTQKKRNYRRD